MKEQVNKAKVDTAKEKRATIIKPDMKLFKEKYLHDEKWASLFFVTFSVNN